jgi:hypothetical protein
MACGQRDALVRRRRDAMIAFFVLAWSGVSARLIEMESKLGVVFRDTHKNGTLMSP